MKLEQLKYVLAVYETGSISKAAKKLYLSQPNVSNAIKNLEKELNFTIFERTDNRIIFTEKGMSLVYHIQSILEEMHYIDRLSAQKSQRIFRLLSPRCTPVEDAFFRLYEEHCDENQFRFVIQAAHQYEAIEMLSTKQADIAVIVSTDINAPSIQDDITRKSLFYRSMYTIPCNVNLSENHPLANRDPFPFDELKNYPYVDYCYGQAAPSPYNRIPQVDFIDLSKIVKADSRSLRSRFVTDSMAYSSGITLPPKRVKELKWKCIPIKGLSMEFGYMMHRDSAENPMILRFLELLREEMAYMEETAPDAPENQIQ